ncbi:MAG: esterase-like activity of phytase family protein, partial [Pseudomonadota bacterium]
CTVFESGVILEGDEEFGGISAMRLHEGELVLISDNALAYSATPVRNEAGFITGLTDVTRKPMVDSNGKALSKLAGDSEGLLVDDDTAIVSFERNHRIALYRRGLHQWTGETGIYEDDRSLLQQNRGYEALAQLKDQRVVAISEGTDDNGSAAVVLLSPAVSIASSDLGWQSVEAQYRPAPDFSVTDAATDPQTGDIYIVERAFSRLRGPRARLVRVERNALIEDALIEGQELARFSALNGIDNMEGLELERREDGTLIAHLISDDNFNKVQQTVLMGLRIREDCSEATIAGRPTGTGTEPSAQEPVGKGK